MTEHRRARGFTLIELMVTAAVMAIVLAGVTAVVSAQQQAYQDGQRVREAQGAARNAILYLERKIATAGFGMAPSLAFDFEPRYLGPCPGVEMGTCPRDSANNSDEIVFYSRNPNYWVPNDPTQEPAGRAWRITAFNAAGNTVTVNAREEDKFLVGQVVQLVCAGATYYAYGTVSAKATRALGSGNGSLTIPLQDQGDGSDPFRGQLRATDPCFTDGTARLFLIDRYRFHVRPVQVSTTGTMSLRYDPYLVLDQGVVTIGTGTVVTEADEQLVAGNIENIQIAYVLNNGTVVGTTPGTPINIPVTSTYPGATGTTNQLTKLVFPGPAPLSGESDYSPTSWYKFTIGPPPAPERLTDHQANIRAVRIVVVGRSSLPDTRAGETSPVLLSGGLLNMSQAPDWLGGSAATRDGLQRVVLETTIDLPNMMVQGMTYF